MNSKSKFKYLLAGIIAMTSASSFANYHSQRNWQLYGGVFAGGYSAEINDKQITTGLPPLTFQLIRTVATQNGALGGGSIGINLPLYKKVFVNAEFSGAAQSGRIITTARTTLADEDVINTTDRLEASYSFDFTTALGFAFNSNTKIYAKIGASLLGFRSTFTSTGFITANNFTVVQKPNSWGIVAGAGITQAINRLFTVFAEYNFYAYENITLNPLIGTTTVTNSIIQRFVAIRANAFRAGLRFNFIS